MTADGQIEYAILDNTYLIKFKGDIRFHLCVSVDRFIQRIFTESSAPKVIIDLLETRALDSTALGVIAQIAIHTRRAYDRRPAILVSNPELIALLKAVSFDRVFTVLSRAEWEPSHLELLEHLPLDEREFTRQVLQAHQNLMLLSRENHLLFKDVSRALEQLAIR